MIERSISPLLELILPVSDFVPGFNHVILANLIYKPIRQLQNNDYIRWETKRLAPINIWAKSDTEIE